MQSEPVLINEAKVFPIPTEVLQLFKCVSETIPYTFIHSPFKSETGFTWFTNWALSTT